MEIEGVMSQLTPVSEEDSKGSSRTPEMRSILKQSPGSKSSPRVSHIDIGNLTPLKILSYRKPGPAQSVSSGSPESRFDEIQRKYDRYDQEVDLLLQRMEEYRIQRELNARNMISQLEKQESLEKAFIEQQMRKAEDALSQDLTKLQGIYRWELITRAEGREVLKHKFSFYNFHMYGKLSVILNWMPRGTEVGLVVPYKISDIFFINTWESFAAYCQQQLSFKPRDLILESLAAHWQAYCEFLETCMNLNYAFPVSMVSMVQEVCTLAGSVGNANCRISVDIFRLSEDLLRLINHQIVNY